MCATTATKIDYVGVNAEGRRVGESHPNAKLSDLQVETIRQLREDYRVPYRLICDLAGIPKSTVEDVCLYTTRGQMPVKLKPIRKKVPDEPGN